MTNFMDLSAPLVQPFARVAEVLRERYILKNKWFCTCTSCGEQDVFVAQTNLSWRYKAIDTQQ